MKHLIVINGKAGSSSEKDKILANAKVDFKNTNYEIYETTGPKSVIPFLKKYLKDNSDDTVRIYACGGDGTVNEVVNGIIGMKNAELAIMPAGTGNDFVKIYGIENEDAKNCRDFKSLIEGNPIEIDVSKIESPIFKEPLYSINVINIGFDAIVGAKGNENARKDKKDPYGAAAIIPAILTGRFNKIVLKADGEQLNKSKLVMGSVAQGRVIGGKYHAAPKSDNTDGYLDVTLMKPMSLVRLMAQYFTPYEKGTFMDSEKLMKRVVYRRAKVCEIIAKKDIDICIDGEVAKGNYFKITCLPKAIKLIPPTKNNDF